MCRAYELDMTARVLVVDDDEQLLNLIGDYLLSLGFEVHCTGEREEAEVLLNNHKYSLVIVDLSLTTVGIEGLDLLKRIAGLTPRPKCIVLSGHTGENDQIAAMASGAILFIEKPCSITRLGAYVHELLEMQQ